MHPTHDIDFDDPLLVSDLLRLMLDKTPAACVVLDADYRIQYANRFFHRLRGLPPGTATGRRCYDLTNGGLPCPLCPVRLSRQDGGHHLLNRKDIMPDGTCLYLEERSIPLANEDGSFDLVLEIIIDHTLVAELRREAGALFHDIIKSLVSVLDKKDAYTSTHSSDVSAISTRLARHLGLSDQEVYRISLGALLHDIGKVLIPDAIINKPGQLTDEEFEIIRRHPVESYRLLSQLEEFEEVKEICLRHHERWDGQGYPDGLAGREIVLGAHIVSLADVYDALTSDRCYRPGMPHGAALEVMRRGLGSHFHPEVGAKFLEMAAAEYPSREALTAGSDTLPDFSAGPAISRPERLVRHLTLNDEAWRRRGPEETAHPFTFTDDMVHSVFDHTPAFYYIIDGEMNILYVSRPMARAMGATTAELTGRKCYEINDKAASCLMEGEGLMCPGQRAMAEGAARRGVTDEIWGGESRSFDLFAIPIEILDRQGQPGRYLLEIMFDRTDEARLQRKIERDIHTVISTLERLIHRIDPAETVNSGAIIRECGSIGEFLARFSDEIQLKYSH